MTRPERQTGVEPPSGGVFDPGLKGTQARRPEEAGTQEAVRSLARRGVRVLLVRLFFVQATSLAVGILLARWLGPAPFGRLAIATAVVSVFNLVGDLGLGAALIRKEGRASDADLSAAFTVQMLAGCCVGTVVMVVGPGFQRLVWESASGRWLLASVVLGTLILGPYRSVATVALERDLRFARISVIEIGEHLVYCAVALALAYRGFGLEALAGALVARTLAGVVLAASLAPWKPRLSLDVARVRPLLGFGVSYQATAVVYLLNSLVAPLLVGRAVGDAGLGLVLWAQGNAERLKPILDVIGRVSFPSYARMGPTAEVLGAGLARTLHGSLLAIGLYGGVLAGTAPLAVSVLYTDRWLPGVPLLYVFLAVFPVAALTILLDVAFLARGDSGLVRNLHLFRALLFWSVAVPATQHWGAIGYALAYGTSIAGFAVLEIACARRVLPILASLRVALGPILAMVTAVGAGRACMEMARLTPVPLLLFSAAAAGLAYLAALLAFDARRVRVTVTSFWKS